jgi:HAE1 family hydrophobic/amphiphilic exporter-1
MDLWDVMGGPRYHATRGILVRDRAPPAREALAEVSVSRLRPILMSVTTAVFGMAPLAIGGSSGAELYQGLAAVVVGGLIVSSDATPPVSTGSRSSRGC